MAKMHKLSLAGLAAIALSAVSANAAITYWVDTANEQVTFNGSWTGGIPGSSDYVFWATENLLVSDHSTAVNPLSGSVSDTEGVTGSAIQYFGAEHNSNSGNVDIILQIIFSEHSGMPGTLTIDNLTFSYAGFSSGMKAYINQLPTLQATMVLEDGTGYPGIAYAIPEASHVGLLLACSAGAALFIRRRLRAKKGDSSVYTA